MMFLLNGLYNKAEQVKGKRLLILILALFAVFLILGLSIGYVINRPLISNEATNIVDNKNDMQGQSMFEGRITFVEPRLYPLDDISYALYSSNGKEVILLKSPDQKLQVSEGHFAQVYGSLAKTEDGSKDVLLVDKVVIKNASN